MSGKAHRLASMTVMEAAIRFASWADDALRHRERLLPEDVMARFECSRPTAYRWIAAYYDARGIARPAPITTWDRMAAA